jgi:exopolyphosphatase / guanosine-5'-triphosphate,3'-diphosphate pyrophosphatase
MTKLAALDLGSNSFHLLEALSFDDQCHFGRRLKEKVQLGAGLDADRNLSQSAINRALDCIKSFNAHILENSIDKITAVGTNTLRVAKNANDFIEHAEFILETPINIIDGKEEARLIFVGVCDELKPEKPGLVIDIGGGSTEFAIGDATNLQYTNSLEMGCVNYYQRFFADGKIYQENLQAAKKAALIELESLTNEIDLAQIHWSVGTSGTIQSISQLCQRISGSQQPHITQDCLNALNDKVLARGDIQGLNFEVLDQNRRAILPAGLAIVSAIFEALSLEQLNSCNSALCEGLLLELNQDLKLPANN